VGGAILALDDALPAASWRWAGRGWEKRVRTDRAHAIAAVELAAGDPEALAARWAQVLDRRATRTGAAGYAIALDQGSVRFVPDTNDPAPHVVGYDVTVADRARVLEAARARGLPVDADAVTIAGTRLALV
jgi:hypothetical protein